MMRIVVPVLLLASGAALTAAAAAPAPAPVTTEAMVSRCKDAPDICKALILKEASTLESAREACIPAEIGNDRAVFRIMETAEEVLEEVPDQFKDFDYTVLARQLMIFLWPCANKPIS